MDKLLYYAATSPEKLDRIGDYLAQRIERYLSRSKFGFVVIGMLDLYFNIGTLFI